MDSGLFCKTIYDYYVHHKRSFAWRREPSPYAVFVSEVMLQQTQTYRVEPKFDLFMTTFPDFYALAQAPFQVVLGVWKGLGYNRRALFLQQAAQVLVQQYGGLLPDDPALLVQLPGIGKATAASMCAFAYNKPTVFIETNIRTVFIHFFFPGQTGVPDTALEPLVVQTVDQHNPREWYYALMDYGVMLKKIMPNPSRQSKHHVRQSSFEGSDRQVRGAILQWLLDHNRGTKEAIVADLTYDAARITRLLQVLVDEGLVQKQQEVYHL